MGTTFFVAGLILTGLTLQGHLSSELGRYAAVGVLGSLALSVFMDFVEGGLPNLIRADLMAILALYFLTLIEFFNTVDAFSALVSIPSAIHGIHAVLWGFAGLALGRHLAGNAANSYNGNFTHPVSPRTVILIFLFCFLVGYSDQLASCNFNPVTVFQAYMGPRFSQPWARGQLGDWRSFFTELELLIYLIPPLAGVVFARRQNYRFSQLILVWVGLVWTLAAGFLSGTRNVFDCYLITFLVAFSFGSGKKRRAEVIAWAGLSILLLVVSTRMEVQFREIGFWNYVTGNSGDETTPEVEGLFVDNNLYVICGLTDVFPAHLPYLGWEVPYIALIRPIPRALWPGKPEGLSTGIEKALGVEGLTLASSFVGESYISAGNPGVFIAGLLFGIMARWWMRFGNPHNSDLGVLIYASGFFAASISMRSLFVFTTAILPTMMAILGVSFLVNRRRQARARQPGIRLGVAAPGGVPTGVGSSRTGVGGGGRAGRGP